MDIIVCVKQAPDFDMVMAEDWVVKSNAGPDIDYANMIINCFDEIAVEYALRINEKFGAHIGIITVGGKECERMLRNLSALGVKDAIRLDTDDDLRFRPEYSAVAIASYLKKAGIPDLILTGRQAGEGDNGQTPQLLAEMLGISCVTNVVEIEAETGGRLKLERIIPGGRQQVLARTPVVVSIGNASNVMLRSATLKERLESKKFPIQVFPAQRPQEEEKIIMTRLFHKKRERNCEMIPFEKAPEEIINMIKLIKKGVSSE
jgi:electron transfer flavoprotein alpha/beta subunit